MGCLFSTTLVKEVVIEFKDIFWDPTSPQDSSLGGSKGVQGVDIEVKGYMACKVSFWYYFSQGGSD